MSIKLESASPSQTSAPRNVGQAMLRGARHTCPRCGVGALFRAYLKVADECPACDQALHHQRADDAPPYFTIFIVGHVAVGGVLALEQAYRPSPWLHAAIWLPFVLVASLWLLPRVKGALVGLQWALRMHGFSNDGGSDLHMTPEPATSNQPSNS